MWADALPVWRFAVAAGLNVSILLSAGLALHAALAIDGPAGHRRVLAWASASAGVGLVFAGTRLAMLSAEIGGSPGAAFDSASLDWAWSALGPAMIALAVGAALIAVAAISRASILAGLGAAAMATAFGLTGHTQALPSFSALASIAVAVHFAIAGFWIAAPLSLWPRAKMADEDLHARLKRFSAVAIGAVPLLAALGVWVGWQIAGGLNGLVSTQYGQLLLFKLAASLLAMAMGALNHRYVTDFVLNDPVRGRRWLKRTLSIETAVFAAAILAVSAATTIAGPSEL